MSTIVIGAGPAGLEAARKLQGAGEEVLVLEAKAHVGGRTRSDREALGNGQAADLGGSFIDRGQDKILEVCADLDVRLTPHFAMFRTRPDGLWDGSSALRHAIVYDGSLLPAAERDAIADEISAALDATPPAPTELVLAWAARSGVSGRARDLLAAQAGTNPVNHAATTPIAEFHPPMIGKLCWMMADGTDSLATAMARDLDVRLNQPVRRVGRTADGFSVETDTDTFTARDVIVAAPVPPTLQIGFDPVLPEWKVNALLATQMSQGGKVIGRYTRGEEVAAGLAYNNISNGPVKTIWCKPVGADDTVVVLGLVPDCGDNVLRDEETALAALDDVVRTTTGVEAERLGGILKDWTQDEYAGGVVSLLFGDRERLQGNLAQAVGSLHFAGEHTADTWANAIDGALRSGHRAADEVIERRARAARRERPAS